MINMALVPYVLEQTSAGERSMDIYSRLLNDRIIVLSDEINSTTASLVVAQLLFLEGQDRIRISVFILTVPAVLLPTVWLFTIQCSTLSAMYQLFVWVWLHLWVHSFFQAVQREREFVFLMQR